MGGPELDGPEPGAPEGAPRCPNCGATAPGAYCPSCGQEQASPIVSLRRYLARAAEDHLHLDSRAVETVRLLLFVPGRLSLDYVEGRRVRRVAPLRLYLLVSAIYFGSLALTDSDVIFSGVWVGGEGARLVRDALPYLMFALMPFFALLLRGLFRARRYFVEHLVFSIHYHSFAFLLFAALAWLRDLTGMEPGGVGGVPPWPVVVLDVLLQVLPFAYLFLALRTFYGESAPRTVAKMLLLGLASALLLGGMAGLVLSLFGPGGALR